MKKCSICGKEFEPYHSRQKTCGDAECKRLHHLAYSKQWAKEHPDMMREYNRLYMRKYRNSLKDYEAEKAKIEKPDFKADGYAERQKARSLEKAGRVEL